MELINEKNSLHWKRNKQEITLQKKTVKYKLFISCFKS